MGKRVMILTASVGSGHTIAAGVLESFFRQAPGVETVQVLDALELASDLYRTLYDNAYFALVEAAPWLVGWSYDYSDPPFRGGNALSLWDQLNTTAVVAAIRAYMVDFGLPADRVTVSGIPVKALFSQPVDRAAVLARYQLQPGLPLLLISAGAAGGAYTRAIVAQTLRMRNTFQAVVVCGRNAELKDEIEALVAPHADHYRAVGYTTDMPDLMRVATFFVGKPGGLSSSECMAAGLPMVLVNPIPGQEVRNSDFLLEEGAAVRCNYETTVGYKIDQLLDAPDRVQRMAASARKLGRPDAAALIVDTVLADPPAPLWISRAAQQAILGAAAQGVAAREGATDRRVQTLVDAATSRSVAVVTAAQLQTLAPLVAAEALFDAALSVTRTLLAALKRQGADPDLLGILGRVLSTADDVTVVLSD